MPRMKLTEAACQRLKPPATGQVEYFDAAYRGLALRITSRGVKSWTYHGRVNGKLTRATLGRYDKDIAGLAWARKEAAKVAEQMRAGENPADVKRAARKAASADTDKDLFESVARDFIERYAKPKNKRWRETARVLGLKPDPADTETPLAKRALIVCRGDAESWRSKRVQEITRRDVLELLDGVVDRGAPIGAKNTLAAIRKLFNWCVERDILQTSPAAGVKPPAHAKARDRVLNENELASVWRSTRPMPYPFGPIFQLLILTGARRGEIGELEWQEVHQEEIRLEGHRTKNGEPHLVPLSMPARKIFAHLPKINGAKYVFTVTGNTAVSGWSKAKAALDDASGVHNWRTHDLRRVIATGLQRLGFRLEVIESVLGHTSGSRAGIVGVYQRHAFEDDKREALEAWGRYVTLLALPRVWSRVCAHLEAGDIAETDRHSVRRERDREFCRLITGGGSKWIAYIRVIARPANAGNVVTLHG